MDEPLYALRGADQTAGAANIHLALFRHRFRSTFGAVVGKIKGGPLNIACQIVHNLRNNVPCPLNYDPVAGSYAQTGNFVTVVQGNIGDDHTSNRYGFQTADGR